VRSQPDRKHVSFKVASGTDGNVSEEEKAGIEMNTRTNCCIAPLCAGGAFFKMPLGLEVEVDTLRLGWLETGG